MSKYFQDIERNTNKIEKKPLLKTDNINETGKETKKQISFDDSLIKGIEFLSFNSMNMNLQIKQRQLQRRRKSLMILLRIQK